MPRLYRSVLYAHVLCTDGIKPVLEMQTEFTIFRPARTFLSFFTEIGFVSSITFHNHVSFFTIENISHTRAVF